MTNATETEIPEYLESFWARFAEPVFADAQTAAICDLKLTNRAGLALSDAEASGTFNDHLLSVHITCPNRQVRQQIYYLDWPRDAAFSLAGRCSGLSFSADHAIRFGTDGSALTSVGFVTRDWRLLSDPPPRVWFGHLEGLHDGLASTNADLGNGRALFVAEAGPLVRHQCLLRRWPRLCAR